MGHRESRFFIIYKTVKRNQILSVLQTSSIHNVAWFLSAREWKAGNAENVNCWFWVWCCRMPCQRCSRCPKQKPNNSERHFLRAPRALDKITHLHHTCMQAIINVLHFASLCRWHTTRVIRRRSLSLCDSLARTRKLISVALFRFSSPQVLSALAPVYNLHCMLRRFISWPLICWQLAPREPNKNFIQTWSGGRERKWLLGKQRWRKQVHPPVSRWIPFFFISVWMALEKKRVFCSGFALAVVKK